MTASNLIRTFFRAVLPGMTALLLGGCFFAEEPYRETRYYDLHLPDTAATAAPIAVGTIRNVTPARQRMSYRKDQSQLIVDEYNRWTQSPDRMLQRYLAASFGTANPADSPAGIWDLEGTLVIFEIDLDDRDVTIGLNYELHQNDVVLHGNLTIQEPFAEAEPGEFAAAASRAAARIAQALRTAVQPR